MGASRSTRRPLWTVALLLCSFAAALGLAGPSSAQVAAPRVLVVGDSLAVGMEPYLGSMIAHGDLVWDARSGRTTPDGLERLRAHLSLMRPDVVIVSLGTNDGPDPARFMNRIHRALLAIPTTACVVWADINRPARKGPYFQLNLALHAIAATHRRLVLVSWDRAVLDHRVLLPDHLHPDATGFLLRSRMYAAAIARGCGQ
jgi:lysophospholipase L1-like esterase